MVSLFGVSCIFVSIALVIVYFVRLKQASSDEAKFTNPDGAKFVKSKENDLVKCPTCKTLISKRAKYCVSCGEPIAPPSGFIQLLKGIVYLFIALVGIVLLQIMLPFI